MKIILTLVVLAVVVYLLIRKNSSNVTSELSLEQRQEIADEYFQRIVKRRTGEANILWEQVKSKVNVNEIEFIVGFTIFSHEQEKAEAVKEKLKEAYEISITRDDSNDVWLVKGSTESYGVELDFDKIKEWIEYMVAVADVNNSGFTNWSLFPVGQPELLWSSEDIEYEEEI